MKIKKYSIGIIGKELFPVRMRVSEDLGYFLYDQISFVLESIGEEIQTGDIQDCRLGVYLDSKNEGSRTFLLKEDDFYSVTDYFGHAFYKKLENFAKEERKKGSDLLFQMNNGEITLDEFDKKRNK